MTAALPSMSLFHIDEELTQLLQYREERMADVEPPDEDEVAALNSEIRRYMEALPRKVASVAGYLRSLDGQEAMADKEAARIAAYKSQIKARRELLKAYVADVLDKQPQPAKGCKKLTGADGSMLMLKTNGGLQPLKVQGDVLPSDYKVATVTMLYSDFERLRHAVAAFGITVPKIEVEPLNSRIREALAAGEEVPGAWLLPRGAHIEVR